MPSLAPERTKKSEIIINGKSDGTTVSPQSKRPFRTPELISDGLIKNSVIKAAEKVRGKIVFL